MIEENVSLIVVNSAQGNFIAPYGIMRIYNIVLIYAKFTWPFAYSVTFIVGSDGDPILCCFIVKNIVYNCIMFPPLCPCSRLVTSAFQYIQLMVVGIGHGQV